MKKYIRSMIMASGQFMALFGFTMFLDLYREDMTRALGGGLITLMGIAAMIVFGSGRFLKLDELEEKPVLFSYALRTAVISIVFFGIWFFIKDEWTYWNALFFAAEGVIFALLAAYHAYLYFSQSKQD
ncbi:MAG: hypothetical protein II712_02530 [Erysipelotrichaceae bacterium]|nr:hypothetical protein [Erysipelotrichaceae bacterium]